MRTTLMESRSRMGRSGRGGEAASVLAHVALVALAVLATRATGEARARDSETELPVYVAPEPRDPFRAPSSDRSSTGDRVSAPRSPLDALTRIPRPDIFTGVPDALPPVDPIGRGLDVRDFEPRGTRGVEGTRSGTGEESGAYNSATVELEAAPLPGSRPPRYPEILRASNVSGAVRMRFVVDTLGRVEPGSVEALSSSHPLFVAAVRSTLLATRFRPARVAERPVRQLVEQRFAFTLDGVAP